VGRVGVGLAIEGGGSWCGKGIELDEGGGEGVREVTGVLRRDMARSLLQELNVPCGSH
jgi:hypothetical protein